MTLNLKLLVARAVLCAVVITGIAIAAPATKSAAPSKPPAQLLSEARSELTASHAYKADALLQQVIKSETAQRAEVEEALVLQGMIYYGDVFASTLLLPSLVAVAKKPEPFGRKVSERMILAGRAFHASVTKYLNITAGGGKLANVKLSLPDFTEADVKKLQDTLSNRASVESLLASYPTDPSAGEGLYSRASQFGMYLGFGGTLPKQKGRKLAGIESKYSGGVQFDNLRYLDWAASVSLDMSKQVKDTLPQFSLKDLSKRCNERLLKVAPKDSQFAKNAKARLEKK
ncbi:MAG: hypothetical protein M3R04_01650 [bacterium]|nr:hypothetical protein [bacterium]